MLEQLFEKINSELLTDEVKLELSAVFESAVNQAIEQKEQELEESNKAEIAEFKDELVTKLDEYLTYFAEEFTKENEQQIEDAVKVKTAERVLGVFEGVVNDFNMKLDEPVIENEAELAEAQKTINQQTEELLEARKEISVMKAGQIVESVAGDLDSEAKQEKFRALAATIDYKGDDEDFRGKLGVMAESLKEDSAPGKLEESLEEEDVVVEEIQPTPEQTRMSKYLSNLKTVN